MSHYSREMVTRLLQTYRPTTPERWSHYSREMVTLLQRDRRTTPERWSHDYSREMVTLLQRDRRTTPERRSHDYSREMVTLLQTDRPTTPDGDRPPTPERWSSYSRDGPTTPARWSSYSSEMVQLLQTGGPATLRSDQAGLEVRHSLGCSGGREGAGDASAAVWLQSQVPQVRNAVGTRQTERLR